jgi:hypothetical protein
LAKNAASRAHSAGDGCVSPISQRVTVRGWTPRPLAVWSIRSRATFRAIRRALDAGVGCLVGRTHRRYLREIRQVQNTGSLILRYGVSPELRTELEACNFCQIYLTTWLKLGQAVFLDKRFQLYLSWDVFPI